MGHAAKAVVDRYAQLAVSGDLGELGRALDEMATDDFVQEYPQSGERISRSAARRINEMYSEATGTSPRMTFKRSLAGDDFFVVEGTIDYGDGVPVSYVGIGEMRGDKLARITEYFANPFEAPAWRAGMVEKMEPTAV